MRRLYVQIYATVIGSLLLFFALATVGWWFLRSEAEEQRFLDRSGEILARVIPGPDRPPEELARSLEELTRDLAGSAAVRSADGALLASIGPEIQPPRPGETASHTLRGRGGPAVALRLPDGRWLLLRGTREAPPSAWLLALLLLVLAIALAAYPVVRRLTRRLEGLQARVEALGAGDLGARVEVEGKDEVADLAKSFNRAAARIESLVSSQRRLLASVSHELRSPLARLRMAAELLPTEGRPELRARVARDVEELDSLLGDLLLAARLEAEPAREPREPVDLLALVAEECAGETEPAPALEGRPAPIDGSPRLLRRLVRNLLENARRHAAGTKVEVRVEPRPAGGALLRVLDRGPGVPAEDRERIFEPFYRTAGARESEGGVGLGLALVRQIAEHHGGRARCIAREGGGTCFEVELGPT